MSIGEITFVQFDHKRQTLLTSTQMRAAEQSAINAGAATGLSMMETAAQGVVDALLLANPSFGSDSKSALVLCGPGNNGGDGFAIARILLSRGWAVNIGLYGMLEKLPADAATNAHRWLKTNSIAKLEDISGDQITKADVIFDAILGTGLKRPIQRAVSNFLEKVARSNAIVVAVDIPSGINSDTGSMWSEDVDYRPRVDHIVTFQRLKPGHLLATSMVPSGNTGARPKSLSIVDLGIERFEPDHDANEISSIGGIPSNLQKENRAHKYEHGHALVFAGGTGKGGAGRLAARAALRVGAGAVTLAAPTEAIAENAGQLNSIMLTSTDSPSELKDLLTDKRKNALCLGPGMGVGKATKDMVLEALRAERPTVLDADALTSFSQDTSALFDLTHALTVLTPHEGEFARLFPDLASELLKPVSPNSRVDLVRNAAKHAGCHILLKGAVTVVASPNGKVELAAALANRAAPWLATAGSGDVLAGFITGLLARGLDPFEAACSAAWLHVECAKVFGPGLIAEDLPDMLPRVLSQWEHDQKRGEITP